MDQKKSGNQIKVNHYAENDRALCSYTIKGNNPCLTQDKGQITCKRCLIRLGLILHKIFHGKDRSRVHIAWTAMKQRCLNPNSFQYKNYGARGITVCERWIDFRNFYADMGDPPDAFSLERIDNSKGYSKANCKWAPLSEQARNRRNNVKLTFNGVTLTVQDWSHKTGVSFSNIRRRMKMGLPIEQVLGPLLHPGKGHPKRKDKNVNTLL